MTRKNRGCRTGQSQSLWAVSTRHVVTPQRTSGYSVDFPIKYESQTFRPMANLKTPDDLTCLSLYCERKGTHTGTGKLRVSGFKPGLSDCGMTVLTTGPLCCPALRNMNFK